MEDTVTLMLSGDVGLGDFSVAMDSFAEVVTGLTSEVAPKADVRWSIEELEAGSARVGVQGRSPVPFAVTRVVEAYERLGEALALGRPLPVSPPVATAAERLVGVIDGAIPSITFETAVRDYVIRGAPPVASPEAVSRPAAYGAVRGRVQTLSSRGRLRFTLYDLLHDRAVSCYLLKGQEGMVQHLWGELVAVEGMVSREPGTSRPTVIRQIRRVDRLSLGGDYRRARGAGGAQPNSLSDEEAIRRVRGA